MEGLDGEFGELFEQEPCTLLTLHVRLQHRQNMAMAPYTALGFCPIHTFPLYPDRHKREVSLCHSECGVYLVEGKVCCK